MWWESKKEETCQPCKNGVGPYGGELQLDGRAAGRTRPRAREMFVGGIKQGWAFAWRSLLAGELLVTFGVVSIGSQLSVYREQADSPGLVAMMIVILAVGVVVDVVAFGTLDRWVRRRHGLAAD